MRASGSPPPAASCSTVRATLPSLPPASSSSPRSCTALGRDRDVIACWWSRVSSSRRPTSAATRASATTTSACSAPRPASSTGRARPLRRRSWVCFANSAADLASVAFNESLCCGSSSARGCDGANATRRGGVPRGRGRAPGCVVRPEPRGAARRGGPSERGRGAASSEPRIATAASSHWTAVAWCDANLAIVLDVPEGRSSR